MSAPVGTCCVVLHTHLPWLAHHGAWPVGEEWLHQAWASAYLPLTDMLARLADEGRRDVLTLGVTPVLAAQLDDPYCLREFHTWLGYWRLRAEGLAGRSEPHLRALAGYELTRSGEALEAFEASWRHGGSPVLRSLADSGVVELLGGPATHPFQPLLDENVARFALRTGLDDGAWRLGRRPEGIWAPECAYRPGLEGLYAAAGVRRFVVDGPTLLHVGRTTADAWTVGDTDVVAFGRDLEVTYRVWSPKRGYPGGSHYRDFHTFDHPSGFRPARVTSPTTPPERKAPYDPVAGHAAVERDARDFVTVVRRRLLDLAAARDGRAPLVVAAYDTELFGHWWHEGPLFLERVLRLLPEAGVRVTSLRGAVAGGHVAGRAEPEAGSWGSGKDFRVWEGPVVADIVAANVEVQRLLLGALDGRPTGRDPVRDQLAREALLALASDWAFMVSKESAADYARRRAADHAEAAARLAAALRRGDPEAAGLATRLYAVDNPFPHLDSRCVTHR